MIIKFRLSSALAQVELTENNRILVTFRSSTKPYEFSTGIYSGKGVIELFHHAESAGKLYHRMIQDQILIPLNR